MQSSKYLIAQGPVNWVEGLEKYYAEDEEKRRRHGEELAARDAEAAQIRKEESPIRALASLAEFSTIVHKAVKKDKVKEKDKTALEQQTARYKVKQTLSEDEQKQAITALKEATENLKFDGAKWENLIRNGNYTPAAKKLLLGQHGSSIVRIQEALGFNDLQRLPQTLQTYLNDNQTSQFALELEEARNSGDYVAERNLYEKFARTRWAEHGFEDDFAIANFDKPLQKLLNTKDVLSKVYYNKVLHNELEKTWNTNFDTAKALHDGGDKNALSRELYNFSTTLDHDKPRVLAHLNRMVRSGQLTRKEWNAMMAGELPEEAKYPAGNLGSHMISTEQKLFIDKEIQAYEHVVVKNAEATVTSAAITLRSKIMNSEDDTPIEELQADKDNMLLRMERMGLQNTDAYKDLVNTDPTLNNREASIAILKDNYAYINGNLQSHRLKDKENFPLTIKSGAVLKQINDLVEQDEIYYRDVSLPTTHKDHVKLSDAILKTSKGQKQKLSTGIVTTTDEFNKLSEEIALKRQEFHIEARKAYPNNNVRAGAEAESHFQQWLIGEGINEIDDGQNPAAGRFSPTNEGIYRISKEERRAVTESSGVGTKANTRYWSQDLISTHTVFGGDKDAALNSPNSLTSHGDIQGSLMNTVRDDKGNIKPYYSPEIIFKARALRMQPAQLLLRQIQALKNSKDFKDQDFYKRHNLAAYEEVLKNDPAIKIEEALVNMTDNKGKKLLFLWQNGVETMTANQITRLIDELSGFRWHKALTATEEIDPTFGHTIRTFN